MINKLIYKASPDKNTSKCITVYFSSFMLLHERLGEHKAKNFQYKISWVKLIPIMSFFAHKWLFCRNDCSAETTFQPKIIMSNLKWRFGQKYLFGYKCLTFQSIERFGSPLMAESFQACFKYTLLTTI